MTGKIGYAGYTKVQDVKFTENISQDKGSKDFIKSSDAKTMADLLTGHLMDKGLFPSRKEAKGFYNVLSALLNPNQGIKNQEQVQKFLVKSAEKLGLKKNQLKYIEKLAVSEESVIRISLSLLVHASTAPDQEKGWAIDSFCKDQGLWIKPENYLSLTGQRMSGKRTIYTGRKATMAIMISHLLRSDGKLSEIKALSDLATDINESIEVKLDQYQPDNKKDEGLVKTRNSVSNLQSSFIKETKEISTIDRAKVNAYSLKSAYQKYDTAGIIEKQIQKVKNFVDLETSLKSLNTKFTTKGLIALNDLVETKLNKDDSLYGEKIKPLFANLSKIFKDGKVLIGDRKNIIGFRKIIKSLFKKKDIQLSAPKKPTSGTEMDLAFNKELLILHQNAKTVATAITNKLTHIDKEITVFRTLGGTKVEKDALVSLHKDYKKLSSKKVDPFLLSIKGNVFNGVSISSNPGIAILNLISENVAEIKIEENLIKNSTDIESTIVVLKKLKGLYPNPEEINSRLKAISNIFVKIESIKSDLMVQKDDKISIKLPTSPDLSNAVQTQMSDKLTSFAKKVEAQNRIITDSTAENKGIQTAIDETQTKIDGLKEQNKSADSTIKSLRGVNNSDSQKVQVMNSQIAELESKILMLTKDYETSKNTGTRSQQRLEELGKELNTVTTYLAVVRKPFETNDDAYFLEEESWAAFEKILDLSAKYGVIKSKDDVGFTVSDFKIVINNTINEISGQLKTHKPINEIAISEAAKDLQSLKEEISGKKAFVSSRDNLNLEIQARETEIESEIQPSIVANEKTITALGVTKQTEIGLSRAEEKKISDANVAKRILSTAFDKDINALKVSSKVKKAISEPVPEAKTQEQISSAQQAQIVAAPPKDIQKKQVLPKKSKADIQTKNAARLATQKKKDTSSRIKNAFSRISEYINSGKITDARTSFAKLKKALTVGKIKGFEADIKKVETEFKSAKTKVIQKKQYAEASKLKTEMDALNSRIIKKQLSGISNETFSQLQTKISKLNYVSKFSKVRELKKQLSQLRKAFKKASTKPVKSKPVVPAKQVKQQAPAGKATDAEIDKLLESVFE